MWRLFALAGACPVQLVSILDGKLAVEPSGVDYLREQSRRGVVVDREVEGRIKIVE